MRRLAVIAAIGLLVPGPWARATGIDPLPSNTGQTGLINMPDARLAPDGTWRTGYSFDRPYHDLWSSISFLPWLEASFRFTRIQGVPGFPDRPDTNYGDYKDKAFDLKVRLLDERPYWPQIVLGGQDVGGGTGLFSTAYAAASKRFGEFDLTLGYGADRIDGVFGGVRWAPQQPAQLVAGRRVRRLQLRAGLQIRPLRRHRPQKRPRPRPRIPLGLLGREGLPRPRRHRRQRMGLDPARGEGVRPQAERAPALHEDQPPPDGSAVAGRPRARGAAAPGAGSAGLLRREDAL